MNWKSCISAVLLAVVCLPLFLTSPATCAGLQYEVVPVAQPADEARYGAVAINENGWICGSKMTMVPPAGNYAFVWDGQQIKDIVPAGCIYALVKDINDSGQVIGEVWLSGYRYAFLWEDGILRDYKKGVSAIAINNPGQIIGSSISPFPPQVYQFTWDGELKPLSSPWQGLTPQIGDINDRGQILGRCVGQGASRPCIWQDDTVVPLPLPDNTAGSYCNLHSINNNGVAVATIVTANLESLVVCEPDGTIRTVSEAYHIPALGRVGLNDHGNIAVTMSPEQGKYLSVIYKNGIVTDLNSLLPSDSQWRIYSVHDINNKGQIAALCIYGDSGFSTAALLQPVIIPKVDIMPNAENIIKTNKQGLIKAAILSDADFDAAAITQDTLQINDLKITRCKITDTNNDGRDDLLCKFRLSDLNLPLGQHTLTIQGTTSDNAPFHGQDSVLIVE